MRKTLGFVSAVALTVGLLSSATVTTGAGRSATHKLSFANPAAAVERQSAINGTGTNHYAVISPTFLGTSSGPQSYIRLFNGAGAANTTTNSTFSVTVVGVPSGNTYGNTFTASIPHLASIQYSIQEILGLASAGSLSGGDTGYAVYLQNADAEAGYQHAVYDWTTHLFENFSSCNTLINEQMIPLHSEVILTNVHTSKQSYPSTIAVHNYYNVPITYTLTVFNAGTRTSTGSLSANSGKKTCQIAGITVGANSTKTIPVSDIQANPACVIDSDEGYMTLTLADQSGGAPNATVTHMVNITEYNGAANMTDVCAVNPVSTTSTGGGAPAGGGYL